MSAPIVVWRFLDGKAGHERQTAGLLKALAPLLTINSFEIDVRRLRRPFLAYLRRLWPVVGLPPPALLIGAGRACQWPMLAAQRARGGRTVYCMKPTLPSRWFDWCLIPQHDGAVRSANIEPTVGVLNDLEQAGTASPPATLVLIGGPSRHHVWDEDVVLKQIGSVVFGRRDEALVISDTRRTPASTSAKLQGF
ncbi:MAG: ELM1/GtrOC1 family putative glycosyltransferase, partial [Gammaproteobacteria bacterium]